MLPQLSQPLHPVAPTATKASNNAIASIIFFISFLLLQTSSSHPIAGDPPSLLGSRPIGRVSLGLVRAMDIAHIRKLLGLTQVVLGRVVGAHSMTVSKWERGVLQPTAFQRSILAALAAAGEARDAAGPARELQALLNRAFIEITEVGSMKLSASNQFKGKVIELDEGPVTTRVLIEIAPKVVITSLITSASVRRLGLKKGKAAVAIIKATEVIVGSK